MTSSACIKHVDRSALVAFAPDAPFFAAGTMAGAVDLSFSSSANLELFKLDFESGDRDLVFSGSIPSSEPFNRLAWGKSSGSDEFSPGLIAGGLVDGNIGVWNPRVLMSSEESESAFVQQLSRHKGPVRGLDFCTLSPNHLASGAEEGEICIWDLTKPTEPTHFPPLKGSESSTHGEISFLSWNKKVQPILASTSFHGATMVWDLRKQKAIISFSDSVQRRCSVLQWHPDFATQLIVASDDDNSPSLRIWDMRNTMTPLRELSGHTKGVVAMEWCPHDSTYLLTCAKDNRTICWDTNSGEIVSELPAGTNWNFDVHWYPKLPGVISASSFDGKIGIYNIEACARYGVGEGYFGSAPLKAPKWYQRKGGVCFGFGGKLVSFHTTNGASEVNVHDLVNEHDIASNSSEFEAAICSGDRSLLRLLCDQKSQESKSEDDKETWGFLKVMFEDDGTARSKLLNHLGFSLPAEEQNNVSILDNLTEEINSLNFDNINERKVVEAKPTLNNYLTSDNGEDFFNNLPSPQAVTPVSNSNNTFAIEESVPVVEDLKTKENDLEDEIDDNAFDDAIQRALVVGDYKEAAAQCIAANKMADALVIAQVGGDSLWVSTRDHYLKSSTSPYLKIVAAMVNSDLVSLVNTRPLKSWKETLALLCTFAQGDEWTVLCDNLASRLVTAGNSLAATLCYICSGNIDKAVEIWSKRVTVGHVGKSYVDLLQELMEKTMVLALATGQNKFSASLSKLVEKYAEILASQGRLSTAMEYLKLKGTDDLSLELSILKDRIALSSEPEKTATVPADYGHSQTHTDVYQHMNSVVEPHQNYYQENYQQQQSVPSYNNHHQQPQRMFVPSPAVPGPTENYQQQQSVPSYNNQHQQPQRSMFVPSPAVPGPTSGFNQTPATTQTATRPFVPVTPSVLRNADQYQQVNTLGSHLYPTQLNGNSNYQGGPPGPSLMANVTGPKLPANVAPAPPLRGFMPVNSDNAVMQRSASGGQIQQPNPITESPPPTVQTADVSNVPAQQKPVIGTLTRLFNETSEALGGSRVVPAKKREIDDNSKKIGALFAKLNNNDISINASEKLIQLCQALDQGDFPAAPKSRYRFVT
ncbi:protein transport protein SEC31 homolog B-like isoform X1 [Bidens hawaiensis]|uniref:protein transport protein SEC31 homolog B-like isoform X1 n=1 Tax=Bidens hawaiensis TaxID=980011 RepID=UPI00404A3AE0